MKIPSITEEKKSEIIEDIRKASEKGELVNTAELTKTISELNSSPKQSKEDNNCNLTPEDLLTRLTSSEENSDIRLLQGAKGYYFFSELHMTKDYADMMIKMEENDNPSLMADVVRKDCFKYPRPTDIKVFQGFPFFMNKNEIKSILRDMSQHPDYQDIESFTTSSGTKYLFSNRYMNEKYATRLAEHLENMPNYSD